MPFLACYKEDDSIAFCLINNIAPSFLAHSIYIAVKETVFGMLLPSIVVHVPYGP